jgi:protein-L-isoaspartate(D-aspartate) O-methyltransferase
MNKKQLIRSLKNQGFSERIIRAFEKVERKNFIPKKNQRVAYEDTVLLIGHGQTISQPYTIAFMLFLLELQNNQKILEIGSGSGYVLDLINEISKNSEIYGIERIKELAEKSKEILKDKKNIRIIYGNGSKGLKDKAPFERILVSATSNEIPQKLLTQLKIGGILVAPVRSSIIQIKKFRNENKIKEFPGFVFVPLIKE